MGNIVVVTELSEKQLGVIEHMVNGAYKSLRESLLDVERQPAWKKEDGDVDARDFLDDNRTCGNRLFIIQNRLRDPEKKSVPFYYVREPRWFNAVVSLSLLPPDGRKHYSEHWFGQAAALMAQTIGQAIEMSCTARECVVTPFPRYEEDKYAFLKDAARREKLCNNHMSHQLAPYF